MGSKIKTKEKKPEDEKSEQVRELLKELECLNIDGENGMEILESPVKRKDDLKENDRRIKIKQT